MKTICTITKTLLLLFVVGNLAAQDCPPINSKKNSNCLTVEFMTDEEANSAVTGPAEILIVEDSGESDGIYIAQMNCGGNKVVFSKTTVCGCNEFDDAVTGKFNFVKSGMNCTYGESGQLLPVGMAYFKGSPDQNRVALTWGTQEEINNDGFDIERSRDGKKFEKIGHVVGEGNSIVQIDYAFSDRQPYSGVNYYRLKQKDLDGASSYSNTISVNYRKDDKISVQYNFGSEEITVRSEGSVRSIEVYDIAGNKLLEAKGGSDSNVNTVSVQNILPGNYVVRVIDTQGEFTTQKFIKI